MYTYCALFDLIFYFLGVGQLGL